MTTTNSAAPPIAPPNTAARRRFDLALGPSPQEAASSTLRVEAVTVWRVVHTVEGRIRVEQVTGLDRMCAEAHAARIQSHCAPFSPPASCTLMVVKFPPIEGALRMTIGVEGRNVSTTITRVPPISMRAPSERRNETRLRLRYVRRSVPVALMRGRPSAAPDSVMTVIDVSVSVRLPSITIGDVETEIVPLMVRGRYTYHTPVTHWASLEGGGSAQSRGGHRMRHVPSSRSIDAIGAQEAGRGPQSW